jgi:hypothetical protein
LNQNSKYIVFEDEESLKMRQNALIVAAELEIVLLVGAELTKMTVYTPNVFLSVRKSSLWGAEHGAELKKNYSEQSYSDSRV